MDPVDMRDDGDSPPSDDIDPRRDLTTAATAAARHLSATLPPSEEADPRRVVATTRAASLHSGDPVDPRRTATSMLWGSRRMSE